MKNDKKMNERTYAPVHKFNDRFAREYRYEPPEFSLTSPYSSIVHNLPDTREFFRYLIHLREFVQDGCFNRRVILLPNQQ